MNTFENLNKIISTLFAWHLKVGFKPLRSNAYRVAPLNMTTVDVHCAWNNRVLNFC